MITALFRRPKKPARVVGLEISEDTVQRVEVRVEATCPCGSQVLHHLTLYSSAMCPRCLREIGVRSMVYERNQNGLPEMTIVVGPVQRTRS